MLDLFLEHLNSIHPNIKFTMETEKDNKLAFLDVLVVRSKEGTIKTEVFRKETHTDRYLNANSHHDPIQKLGVLRTLAHRARNICSEDRVEKELQHLKQAFKNNGYTDRQITSALRQRPAQARRTDIIASIYMPYVKGVTDKIASAFSKRDIKTVLTDRKSTRLNSSHVKISYAVFCLKKKKNKKVEIH